PPNVPALDSNTVSAMLPIRERLAAHRANPACASCHNVMDPVGFALENYDAVGRWRSVVDGQPVDASGGMPDGSTCTGVAALERGLLGRPELFAATLSGKLLTFALGRGVQPEDASCVGTGRARLPPSFQRAFEYVKPLRWELATAVPRKPQS
ncbi:MAG: DUF1588 domain-containing protein, partial [Planctomycetales bacterium]